MSRITIIFKQASSIVRVLDGSFRDFASAADSFAQGCTATVQVDGTCLPEDATTFEGLVSLVQEANVSLGFRCVGCGN